jgi:hypothetical protein
VAIYKAQQSTPPNFSRQNSSLNHGTHCCCTVVTLSLHCRYAIVTLLLNHCYPLITLGTPALPLAFKKGSQRLDELQDKVCPLHLRFLASVRVGVGWRWRRLTSFWLALASVGVGVLWRWCRLTLASFCVCWQRFGWRRLPSFTIVWCRL